MKMILLAEDVHAASASDYIFLSVMAVLAIALSIVCIWLSMNFNKWIQEKVKNRPGEGKPEQ